MNSVSRDGNTRITLQFNIDRDIDAAAQDVQSAIAAVQRRLPDGMEPPVMRKLNPADSPILFLGFTGENLTLSRLNEFADTRIAQRLSMIQGVAQVQIFGAQKYALRLYVDPSKLAKRNLGLEQVVSAVQQGNSNLPSGSLDGGVRNYSVKVDGSIDTAREFRNVVVAYRDGAPVRTFFPPEGIPIVPYATGIPKTAMAILAFPLATLDPSVMREVLEGARSKIIEAGCSMVGGHSIDDETLKFGLSVTGLVHPSKILSNRTARPGDVLLLTKPLGTGTLCAGLKNGDYTEDQIRDALDSMALLNDLSGLLSEDERAAIHAATDITGFGLLGHTLQVARASNVSISLDAKALPVFALTHASLKAENLTKAHRSNQSYTRAECTLDPALSAEQTLTLFDPQTSGGLLLSVAPEKFADLAEKIRKRFPATARIGTVAASGLSRITVHA
ncbi:MAG: selenide, water dikinase SelD [Proteobacteria bacterium]|nr:selenide, water dikinase SelD [Pseudomonadota bacterium]